MRLLLVLTLIIYSTIARAAGEAHLYSINPKLFVNGIKTNLYSILQKDNSEKTKLEVIKLWNLNQLSHDYTKVVSKEYTFKDYWRQFNNNWFLLDLNKDGNNELIFLGKSSYQFDSDFEILFYTAEKDGYKRLFAESGKLIGYKIQPNTNNIILYHHKAPCCDNGSHNIYTLRLLGTELHIKDKFFVGTDTGAMSGDFFPDMVNYTGAYKKLKSETIIHWSKQIIKSKAWIGRQESNAITAYPKNTYYKELFRDKEKSYVLISGNPVKEFSTRVINPANFIDKPIFGWIFHK